MPPTTNDKNPLIEYPYVHQGKIFLISNYKPDKKKYFHHASGEELTQYLLAGMQQEAKATSNNIPLNITLFAPMPGRMYYLNRSLVKSNNGVEVKASASLEKFQPETNSSSSLNLINLSNYCDIDAYDEIVRWINDQSTHILAAADSFSQSNANWNIHIRVPHLDRTTEKTIKLTQLDLYEQNRPMKNRTDNTRPVITINFLHQWPDLYSAQDKIRELANLVIHFNKGRSVFQSNSGQYNIANLFNKKEHIAEYNVNLNSLPALEELDLKTLCNELNISYEDYEDADKQQQLGLKSVLQQNNEADINDIAAVNVFIKTFMVSFMSFTGSKNGLMAKGGGFKNSKDTPLVNQAFWGNILFIVGELPLLILAGGQLGANDKIEYNQNPNTTESLRLLREISSALGKNINFHQPSITPDVTQGLEKSDSNTNLSYISTSPTDSVLSSATDEGEGGGLPSNNRTNSLMTAHRKDSGGSASANTVETDKKSPAQEEAADALEKEFTKYVNLAITQICKPNGRYYNVYLALDFLNSIIGWYANTLNTIAGGEFNQHTYGSLDRKFWMSIETIAENINTALTSSEQDKTQPAQDKTQQKECVEQILATASNYLDTTKQEVKPGESYSVKNTFTSRATLNAWWEKVMEVKTFESSKPKSKAADPALNQKALYEEAKINAGCAFTYLAASSEGTATLQELRRTTQTFTDNFQARKPHFSS